MLHQFLARRLRRRYSRRKNHSARYDRGGLVHLSRQPHTPHRLLPSMGVGRRQQPTGRRACLQHVKRRWPRMSPRIYNALSAGRDSVFLKIFQNSIYTADARRHVDHNGHERAPASEHKRARGPHRGATRAWLNARTDVLFFAGRKVG